MSSKFKPCWSAGIRYRENTTGRTGHEHFPGLIVPIRGAKNTAGHAYAFHYGWSGGHKMVAEELADGVVRFNLAMHPILKNVPKPFSKQPPFIVLSQM